MGLFHPWKKPKESEGKKDLASFMKGYSATAMDYGRDFHKTLDYSAGSVEDLEEILDFYAKDIAVSQPTDHQIESMAILFGAYLGETLLHNGLAQKGYGWGKDTSSQRPLLVSRDGCLLTPIDKVYKRLVNGQEDNVMSFYRFAVTEL